MIQKTHLIANVVLFAAQTIFLVSLFPQIILNFKHKSTRGLSDLFLIAVLNANYAWVGYAFSLKLPIVFGAMNVLYSSSVTIIVLQRMYYSDFLQEYKVNLCHIINILVMLFVIWYAITYSVLLGMFLGWFSVAITLFRDFPQIFKVRSSKSVYGFSKKYVLIGLLAFVLNFLSCFALGLPFAVLFSNLKGICFGFFFLLQFTLYTR